MLMIQGKSFQVSRFSSGETIFKEGQSDSVAYSILSGEVELSVLRGNRHVVLDTLGQGAYFGELPLLLKTPNSIRATAIQDAELQVISSHRIESLLDNTPPLMRDLILEHARQLYQKVSSGEQGRPAFHSLLAAGFA